MNTSTLLLGVLVSSVGMGLFMYGKKQGVPAPLVCGLGLMVLPYCISNLILLGATGIGLMAVPYFYRT